MCEIDKKTIAKYNLKQLTVETKIGSIICYNCKYWIYALD